MALAVFMASDAAAVVVARVAAAVVARVAVTIAQWTNPGERAAAAGRANGRRGRPGIARAVLIAKERVG